MSKKKRLASVSSCRKCKRAFRKIEGIKQYDEGCCSERCFIEIGPVPPKPYVVKVIPESVPFSCVSRKERKKIAKQQKKRKQGSYKSDKYFYRSQAWLELRYEVLTKYGRTCMACGVTKGSMHVDHIKPKSLRPDLALTFNNLQVLCRDCNMGKLNHDDTDFRDNHVPTKNVLPVVNEPQDTVLTNNSINVNNGNH